MAKKYSLHNGKVQFDSKEDKMDYILMRSEHLINHLLKFEQLSKSATDYVKLLRKDNRILQRMVNGSFYKSKKLSK